MFPPVLKHTLSFHRLSSYRQSHIFFVNTVYFQSKNYRTITRSLFLWKD